VIIIGAIAYGLAVVAEISLVQLLLLSYGFIAQLFPLTVVTFLWPRVTRQGALWGLLAGGVVTVLLNLVPSLAWGGIHPGIYGIAFNVVAMVSISLLTARMDPEHVSLFTTAGRG
jgi:SSS family solute:Na+ symporter